jgi:hypothetical protein
MFMKSSRVGRGEITSTNTTALAADERQQRRQSARLTATSAAYREAI